MCTVLSELYPVQLSLQVVGRLCACLPRYTYPELASITYNLSSLRHRPKELAGLVELLDTELTGRLGALLGPRPGQEQIEDCLQVVPSCGSIQSCVLSMRLASCVVCIV